MSKILERRARRIATGSGAAVVVVLGSPLLAAAAPAQFAPPVQPYATVTSQGGLNERQYPSTDSSVVNILDYQDQVGVRCKVRAQTIAGNDVWYLLRDTQAWISASYVVRTGTVPYCKDIQVNRLTHSPQATDAMG
ncbi:SH3 domain-containing protein [Streptomyces sp. NPDC005262]|uniref:SH3 domain-containing protein n=1 Tax=Streptomyces sp. NPDC005262 TaxID=3364710 RepID=UPI0036C6AC29